MNIWIVDSEFDPAIGIWTEGEKVFYVKSKEKGERIKMLFYEIDELTAVWINQL